MESRITIEGGLKIGVSRYARTDGARHPRRDTDGLVYLDGNAVRRSAKGEYVTPPCAYKS